MDVQEKAKEYLEEVGMFFSILGGLAAGQIAMSFVPSTKNATGDKILPGAIGIAGGIATVGFSKNPYIKSFGRGLGLAGTANVISKFTAGSPNTTVQKINQATTLPAVNLNGGFGQLPEATATAQEERMLSGFGRLGQAPQMFLS